MRRGCAEVWMRLRCFVDPRSGIRNAMWLGIAISDTWGGLCRRLGIGFEFLPSIYVSICCQNDGESLHVLEMVMARVVKGECSAPRTLSVNLSSSIHHIKLPRVAIRDSKITLSQAPPQIPLMNCVLSRGERCRGIMLRPLNAPSPRDGKAPPPPPPPPALRWATPPSLGRLEHRPRQPAAHPSSPTNLLHQPTNLTTSQPTPNPTDLPTSPSKPSPPSIATTKRDRTRSLTQQRAARGFSRH